MSNAVNNKNILITGINSSIGSAFAKELASNGWSVDGTYRNKNALCAEIQPLLDRLYEVDFSDTASVSSWLPSVNFSKYNAIFFVHGAMSPIGKLAQVAYSEWLKTLQTNYLSIIQTLNQALPNVRNGCKILTLAGGGVNSAPSGFNAYTASKTSLVKMNEILAAEYPDQIFLNIGPGWVESAIHKQTMEAKDVVPSAFEETIRRYKAQDFIQMDLVTESLLKLLNEADKNCSGRNFSVASKEIFDQELLSKLEQNSDLFKLRRNERISQ